MTSEQALDYSAYLQSVEWKERRVAALERSRRSPDKGLLRGYPRCEVCGRSGVSHKTSRSSLDSRERRFRVEGSNGLQVHHLHYRTLGREEPSDLIVLCTATVYAFDENWSSRMGCHERAHDDPDFRTDVLAAAAKRGL